jgi:hypothetical protein
MVKPKDVAAKSALKRSYIGKYAMNKDGYRKRKLGEKPFENAEKRSLKCYYQKDKEKGMKFIHVHTISPHISWLYS